MKMFLGKRIPIAACIILLGCGTSLTAQTLKDDIILSAMVDELKHNMDCLRLKDHEPPFFISYGMDDLQTHQLIGILGALYYASEDRFRGKSVRVLAGDYDFNDESLEGGGGYTGETRDIELPIENDYPGIRRAYWSTTDQVYKGAARQFARNREALAEQKKPLAEIPYRSFARITPSILIKNTEQVEFNKGEWEDFVKEISSALIDFEEIESSMVYLTFQQGYHYFASSEGMIIKSPVQMATLQVSVQYTSAEGEIAADEVTYHATVPSGLPSVAQVRKDALALARRIVDGAKIPTLKEEYTGPVLFENEPVPDVFMSAFFSGRETLRAHNIIPSLTGLQYDLPGSLENRIGKPILPSTFTVRTLGELKTWNGKTLFGHFDADDEGVIPPDTLMLVEKGILRNLLQDRTLTSKGLTSNGYSNQLGIVEVEVDNTCPADSMKQKLIEAARAQGSDYAYIIRHAPDVMGSTMVSRVNVETGGEELLKNGDYEPPSLRDLRDVLRVSEERQVLHTNSDIGDLSSWIVPRAVLFGDITILPANVPTFKETNFVSRPPLPK